MSPVIFQCDNCQKECSRPQWEYKRTILHFCSQSCSTGYRNRKELIIPNYMEKKHKLSFLNSFVKNKKTYFSCLCDCGNTTEIYGPKFGYTQMCGDRTRHKGNMNASFKGYKEISSTYWNSVRHGAKTRDYEFAITIEYAWDLFVSQNKKCALSGSQINLDKNFNKEATASLDRIDSSKGYVKGNVQWVHKKVNILKLNMPEEEFILWCKKIASHNKVKGLQSED